EDHQILVDDRRRRVRVVRLVDLPDEPLAQIDDAVGAEARYGTTGTGVEADQTVAAVDEDPQRVAVAGVAPGGDASVDEACPVRALASLVRLWMVGPQLAAGLGVERDHAVVRRTDVEHAVDHDRRRLKVTRARAELGERLLTGGPLPRHGEARVIRRVDVGQRRVFRSALIAPVERPVTFRRLARLRVRTREGRGVQSGWRSAP